MPVIPVIFRIRPPIVHSCPYVSQCIPGLAYAGQAPWHGNSVPLSRSWNQIVFQAGFDRKNWQVFLRPWIRLRDEEDENPAIADFIGRGEAIVIRNIRKHQLSLVGTHSLRTGSKNRGCIQGNWVFPVWGNFKGQLQVSEGYGETLIDYNHRQATAGLSVSLMEW